MNFHEPESSITVSKTWRPCGTTRLDSRCMWKRWISRLFPPRLHAAANFLRDIMTLGLAATASIPSEIRNKPYIQTLRSGYAGSVPASRRTPTVNVLRGMAPAFPGSFRIRTNRPGMDIRNGFFA
jgi:hypothetical protein